MTAHEAALQSGGRTIVVLPEGIDRFRVKKAIEPVWDWNRALVISYFPRNAVWRADRAMDRNKVIVGLSDAVIVLEARESGGTLNAGFCALQMRKPLFVALYEDMNGGREGNQLLIHEGATPLRRSRASGQAQIDRVLQAIGDASARAVRQA
jgi:DNA processing protein